MTQRFQWDPRKDAANQRKHRVSFEEASTAWSDPNALFLEDAGHSQNEERSKIVGFSRRDHLLSIIFTERTNAIRIITARKATTAEKAAYAEGLGGTRDL